MKAKKIPQLKSFMNTFKYYWNCGSILSYFFIFICNTLNKKSQNSASKFDIIDSVEFNIPQENK